MILPKENSVQSWHRRPWEGRREAMQALFSQVQHFTLEPKFLLAPNVTLIAPAMSQAHQPKDGTVLGAVQNVLSVLVAGIQPNQPEWKEPKNR